MVPEEIKDLRNMQYLPMNIPEDFNNVKITLFEEKYGLIAEGVYFKILGLICNSKEKCIDLNELKQLKSFSEIDESLLIEVVETLFVYDNQKGTIKSEKVEKTLREIKKLRKNGSRVKKSNKTAL